MILRRLAVLILLLSFFPSALFALDPNFRKYYETAVGHLQKDEYDPAIENFQKALDLNPDPVTQARVYNLIGLAYMKQNVSMKSALGSFEQAIKLDPKFAEAYFNVASVYASNGLDPTKAAEYFQKTIEVDPNYSKAYFGLGWFSLMQKEEPQTALEYFDKTLKVFPDFAEAHYGRGLAYIRLNKPHMVLGSVSQLRSMGRDDLATTLEQTVNQMTAEASGDTLEKPAGAAGTEAKPAGASAQPARRGRSPFEMLLQGKAKKSQPAS